MTSKVLIVLGVFLIVLAGYAAGLHEKISLSELKVQQRYLQDYYFANPLTAVSMFAAGYVLFTAFTLPGQTILTLAGGAIFGSVIGTVIVSFSAALGALIAFWLARFVFRDYVQHRFSHRLKAVNEAMAKDGPSYLFSARLLPIVPFPILNAVMALTSITSWQYFSISYLAMLPGIAIFVIAGTKLSEINSLMDILSAEMFLLFVALGLLPWLPAALRWLGNKVSKRAT